MGAMILFNLIKAFVNPINAIFAVHILIVHPDKSLHDAPGSFAPPGYELKKYSGRKPIAPPATG
jgi:hypothetical protein